MTYTKPLGILASVKFGHGEKAKGERRTARTLGEVREKGREGAAYENDEAGAQRAGEEGGSGQMAKEEKGLSIRFIQGMSVRTECDEEEAEQFIHLFARMRGISVDEAVANTARQKERQAELITS